MKRKIIDQFFDHLMKSLNTDDLGTIANDVDKHIDEEGNLYLRLNKQAAYMGEVRLRQEDPIRIKMKLIDDVGRGKPQMELVRKLIEDYEKIR
jgi:RNA binding exosome subunit